MKLNEKIVYLRKNKQLSQAQVCEALHISRQSLSKWENGLVTPSDENLVKLAQFFEISLDYFKDEEEALIRSPKKKRGGWILGLSLLLLFLWLSHKPSQIEVIDYGFKDIGTLEEVLYRSRNEIVLKFDIENIEGLSYEVGSENENIISNTPLTNNQSLVISLPYDWAGKVSSLGIYFYENLEQKALLVLRFK